MFKFTENRGLEVDNLINGYANNLITDDELDFMLDITLGDLRSVNMEF